MSGYLYNDFINCIYNSPLILLIYALLFSFIVLYINKHKVKTILYVILLFIITALSVCLYTNNLLYLFIGIEAYSILFILLLYNTCESCEFLLEIKKLLLLSMVISSIMAFGTTLVLLDNNNLYFGNINICSNITVFGLSFVLIGILFKLCVFPFHIWILDIYKKSPYYIVLISDCFLKIILLRVLLNFITQLYINVFNSIFLVLGTISMFLGLIPSIRENNIKRFLGLFNISHIGLILLLISANNINSCVSVFGYLLMYSTCSLAFLLSVKDTVNDFRDLKMNTNIRQKNINNFNNLEDNISIISLQERINNIKNISNNSNKMNDFKYLKNNNIAVNTNIKHEAVNNVNNCENNDIEMNTNIRQKNINNFNIFKKNNIVINSNIRLESNNVIINSIISIISLISMMCIPPFHTFLSKVDLILLVLKYNRYTVLILIIIYFILEMVVILMKMRMHLVKILEFIRCI